MYYNLYKLYKKIKIKKKKKKINNKNNIDIKKKNYMNRSNGEKKSIKNSKWKNDGWRI